MIMMPPLDASYNDQFKSITIENKDISHKIWILSCFLKSKLGNPKWKFAQGNMKS